jgi:hypothetical protein
MKRVLALVALALLGFAVAGCGSAKKGGSVSVFFNTVDTNSPSGTIFVAGTKTFANLRPGTPIACKGGAPRLTVRTGEAEVAVAGRWEKVVGGSGSSPTTRLAMTRNADGRITVTCTRGS